MIEMQKVVDMLNEAFAADPNAMHSLIVNRVPCNLALADHPHIVVDKSPVLIGDHFSVGLGGILAGICTTLGQPIIATEWSEVTDEEGRRKLIGFCLTKKTDDGLVKFDTE